MNDPTEVMRLMAVALGAGGLVGLFVVFVSVIRR